jgi:hypothetical protein
MSAWTAWMFKGNVDRYDFFAGHSPLATDGNWLLSQNWSHIAPGDDMALWVGGDDRRGIYLFGKVLDTHDDPANEVWYWSTATGNRAWADPQDAAKRERYAAFEVTRALTIQDRITLAELDSDRHLRRVALRLRARTRQPEGLSQVEFDSLRRLRP